MATTVSTRRSRSSAFALKCRSVVASCVRVPAMIVLCIALTLSLISGGGAPCNAAPAVICTDNTTEYFSLNITVATWENAEMQCQSFHGHIATLDNTSANCNPNLYGNRSSMPSPSVHWAAGTRLLNTNGVFRDVSNHNSILRGIEPSRNPYHQCSALDAQRPYPTFQDSCCQEQPLPFICERKLDPSARFVSSICQGQVYSYHSIAFSGRQAADICTSAPIHGHLVSASMTEELNCTVSLLTSHPVLTANNVTSIPIYTDGNSSNPGQCMTLDVSTVMTSSSLRAVQASCSTPRPVVCVSVFCSASLNEEYHGNASHTRRCVCMAGYVRQQEICTALGQVLIGQGISPLDSTTVIAYRLLENTSTPDIWRGVVSVNNAMIRNSTVIDDVRGTGAYVISAVSKNHQAVVFVRANFTQKVEQFLADAYRDERTFMNATWVDDNITSFRLLTQPDGAVDVFFRNFSLSCYGAAASCDRWQVFGSSQRLPAGRYEIVFQLNSTVSGQPDYTMPIPFVSPTTPLPTPPAATPSSTSQEMTSSTADSMTSQPSSMTTANTQGASPGKSTANWTIIGPSIGVGFVIILLVVIVIVIKRRK